jgi:simple sugar transport system permease protein
MQGCCAVRLSLTQAGKSVYGRVLDALPLLIALLLGLLAASALLVTLAVDPRAGFGSMLQGAFGSENNFAETLVKATPMLFVAIGICVAFRGGMTNVGGEGQMIMGALAGVSVVLAFSTEASWWVIPLAVIAGFIAGGLYGALAGWLKAFFSVNEILSTIMLNAIAVQVMNFLLNGPLLDPSEAGVNNIPKTARIAETLQIPRLSIPIPQGLADLFTFENAELFARTRLHWGFVLAVILAVVAYYLLWRTTIGYRIRAVGENDRAARFAGMRVRWNMVLSMFISGGFAGLAGVVQVLGLVYRLQTDGSPTGFTGNAGFNGIVVALLGGLNPIGAIFASVFFGGLLVGAQKMQRDLGVPASLITAINGLIVIFVVCSEYFVRWRARRKALAKTGPPAMTEPVPVPRASELTAGQPSP